jgi:hypothetical protein
MAFILMAVSRPGTAGSPLSIYMPQPGKNLEKRYEKNTELIRVNIGNIGGKGLCEVVGGFVGEDWRSCLRAISILLHDPREGIGAVGCR